MKKNVYYFVISCLLISCQEIDQVSSVEKVNPTNELSISSDFIEYLKILGFKNPESFKIQDMDSLYIVNNYFLYRKDDFKTDLERLQSRKESNLLWRSDYFTQTTPNQKRIIPYRFYGSVGSDVIQLFKDAFDTWNGIRNFNIEFVNDQEELLGTSAIWISSYTSYGYYVSGPTDYAEFGNTILYHPGYLSQFSAGQKKMFAIYAVGHLIGIVSEARSGLSFTQLVPGTFDNDPYSIFKPVIENPDPSTYPEFTNFSFTDLLGIRYLWPHDPTEKPIYSYIHHTTGWGNWSLNWNQFGYGTQTYGYWGVTGYIFTSQKPNTVPLYSYTHSTGTPYLSTTSNLHTTFPSFSSNGVFGRVYNSPGTNRIPIYEWYNPNVGYYFTTNQQDGYVQGPGWIGGSVAFYTLSLM